MPPSFSGGGSFHLHKWGFIRNYLRLKVGMYVANNFINKYMVDEV